MSGRKTWTVTYGLGDSLALALAGLSAGSISLEQTLAVDVEAGALGIIFVEAHFNDQEEESLQSLVLRLDTEKLDGVAGDFVVPDMGSFSTYSRKMKGVRLDYEWGIATITAIASKLEGVTKSKTFTGETAEVTVVFSYTDREGGETASYLENLEGLASFTLVATYVEELDEPMMVLDLSSGLSSVLAQFGVTELAAALDGYEGKNLVSSEFSVIGDEPQYLVLRVAPETILRRAIKDAIDVYNGATDEDLEYPFSSGSDAETQFLAAVLAYTLISVGEDLYGVQDAEMHFHYALGEKDVVEDSLEIELDADGSGYQRITEASWSNYGVNLYVDEGILEILLPEAVTSNPDAALRVTYSYTVFSGAYSLGLSVVPGTEKILLNRRLLVRDTDYAIDYEIGYVTLFTKIGSSDVLEIEYEVYGSGSSDYARYFAGVTADIPLPGFGLDLYLLESADDAGSVDNADTVSTMPNRQIVAGVSGTVELPDTTAGFNVGYVNDRFPYDDNNRTPRRNQVNAFGFGSDYVLVGNEAGFSVFSNGSWRAYDTSDGLAGRSVRAIAMSEEYAFLGTSAGLTAIALDGISPFDRQAQWSSYQDDDGLPDSSVHAMLLDGTTLYVGTEAGVARVAVADLENDSAWTTIAAVGGVGVTALALDGDWLYVGTEDGLVVYNTVEDAVLEVDGTSGMTYALYAEEGTVYAASDQGLHAYVEGLEVEEIATSGPVYAVGVYDGEVYYGTGDGLVRASDGTVLHAGWVVTGLAESDEELWIGTEADAGYALWVWLMGNDEVAYDGETMEIAGANPYLYDDPEGAEHTSTGWVVGGSFDHSTDAFSLSGTVDRVQEGYRAIGSSSRSDDGGWMLDGSVALGPNAKLGLSHSYEIDDLTATDRSSTLENDLSFSGNFGPTIAFKLHQESEDTNRAARGAETDRMSYTLSVDDKLFGDIVKASIDWSEAFLWDEANDLSRSAVLSASAVINILEDWTSTVSWRRPVYTSGDDWSGGQRFAWGVDGSATFAGVEMLTEYDFVRSRSLPDGDAAYEHAGRVRLALDAITWEGCKMTPNLDLSGGWEDEELSLTAKLTLRTAWTALSGRTTLTADVEGFGAEVERWTEKVSSTWGYTGIASIRPTLTYSATRNVVNRRNEEGKVVETEETIAHSLTGRMMWSSPEGDSDTLSATFRCEYGDATDVAATLDNSYQRDITNWVASLAAPQSASGVVAMSPYPTVTVGTDLSADWSHQDEKSDASWTVSGDTTVLFSKMWSASLSVSYSGGFTESGTWYNGAWFALTVAIDF
ncbi:MAG: hypothetical protein NTY63_05620 [Candidatus Bipolaricaulota bacterium]|nr:hypothetical protein [Candidatus Bipolaricaulota bacterium]